MATLGEGTFGKVVKVKDVTKARYSSAGSARPTSVNSVAQLLRCFVSQTGTSPLRSRSSRTWRSTARRPNWKSTCSRNWTARTPRGNSKRFQFVDAGALARVGCASTVYLGLVSRPVCAACASRCSTGSTTTATCASPSRCSACPSSTFWYDALPFPVGPRLNCLKFAEGQQLPAVLARPGAPHRLPAVLRRALPARQQAHPHRPEAGEHPVRRLGL